MIKKSIIFSIFLMFSIICSPGLFSAESSLFGDKVRFNFSTEFGIMNGSIGEYVIAEDCKNTGNMLSRLDWDVIAVPYVESGLSVDLFKYLFIGISGRGAFPVFSGVMQDYDWLNSMPPEGFPHWIDDDPTELTNYSKHNNQVDKCFGFTAKIGGNIPISKIFSITPYVGYLYDIIEMSAHGGYTKYKWNNFQEVEVSAGKCISYAQEINEFIIGIQADFSAIPRLPLFFDFHFVPGLGKLVALDIHYGRNLAFLDVISPLILFDGKLSGYFEINGYNKIGLSSFFHYMPYSKGINGFGVYRNGKLPEKFIGSKGSLGGASRFLYGFSIVYRLNF